jgi:hypothetical protein
MDDNMTEPEHTPVLGKRIDNVPPSGVYNVADIDNFDEYLNPNYGTRKTNYVEKKGEYQEKEKAKE